MKMKKKSLIMLVCAVMIVSSVAFGTIAYLTDHAVVTNRFTVGNVDIVADETKVGADGKPVYPEGTALNPDGTPVDPNVKPERTEVENEYPLTPGAEFVKDPTITVKAGSEETYVRMMVTITKAAEIKEIFADLATMYPEKYANGFLPEEHVTGWDRDVWACVGMTEDTEQNTFTLEFRNPSAVSADGEDSVLPALFETIKIPGELTNGHLTKLEGFTIDVYGNAIQSTGFDSADAAWTAFDAQIDADTTVVE